MAPQVGAVFEGSRGQVHDSGQNQATEVNPESWTQLKGSNEKGI